MQLRSRLRTTVGATVLAALGVLLVRVLINLPDVVGSWQEVRPWLRLQAPFALLLHVEAFWLESLLIAAAALFVMWATRRASLRTIAPVCLVLLIVDTVAMLGSDAVLVVGSNQIISAEHVPVPPTGWDLLLVDAVGVLLWNATTILVAIVVALVLARVLGWTRWQVAAAD